jgi:hypothetical protein
MGPFRQGLARVEQEGGIAYFDGEAFASSGYIDKNGKWIIRSRLRYWFSEDFSEGLVPVATSPKAFNKTIKWKNGYFDLSGKLCVKPQFDDAGNFSEGFAPVTMGQNCGYIEKSGEYVIKPQFQSCGGFSEGVAPVRSITTR